MKTCAFIFPFMCLSLLSCSQLDRKIASRDPRWIDNRSCVTPKAEATRIIQNLNIKVVKKIRSWIDPTSPDAIIKDVQSGSLNISQVKIIAEDHTKNRNGTDFTISNDVSFYINGYGRIKCTVVDYKSECVRREDGYLENDIVGEDYVLKGAHLTRTKCRLNDEETNVSRMVESLLSIDTFKIFRIGKKPVRGGNIRNLRTLYYGGN